MGIQFEAVSEGDLLLDTKGEVFIVNTKFKGGNIILTHISAENNMMIGFEKQDFNKLEMRLLFKCEESIFPHHKEHEC